MIDLRIDIEPVDYYCHYCDSAMEATGCEAPHCSSYRCLNCRAGCDLEELDDGVCAVAITTMSYAQRRQRREERQHHYYGRPMRTVHLPEMDRS